MSDAFDEVFEPLTRVRRRLADTLKQFGLGLIDIGISPAAATEGPHTVHIFAMLDGEPLDAKVSVDRAQFDEVLRGARDAELERQSQEAVEELRRGLRDDGFL